MSNNDDPGDRSHDTHTGTANRIGFSSGAAENTACEDEPPGRSFGLHDGRERHRAGTGSRGCGR